MGLRYETVAIRPETTTAWAFVVEEDPGSSFVESAECPQLDDTFTSCLGWMTGVVPGLTVVFDPCPAYRSRQPEASGLYRVLQDLYERVKLLWEERFEPRYGPWRGFYDQAIARYLDCGILKRGFARVFCDSCRHDFIVALACRPYYTSCERAAVVAKPPRLPAGSSYMYCPPSSSG
jgi:hypothetical protein